MYPPVTCNIFFVKSAKFLSKIRLTSFTVSSYRPAHGRKPPIFMPNVRDKDKRQINLWIDDELKRAAEERARQLGLSTTEYIARCIDRGLRVSRKS